MPDPLNEWFAAHPRFPEMAEELVRLAHDPKWRRLVELEERFVGVVAPLREDPELPFKWLALGSAERLKKTFLLSADEHAELDSLRQWYCVARDALLNKYGWRPGADRKPPHSSSLSR